MSGGVCCVWGFRGFGPLVTWFAQSGVAQSGVVLFGVLSGAVASGGGFVGCASSVFSLRAETAS